MTDKEVDQRTQDLLDEIATSVKQQMDRHGLTQTDVANAVDCHRQQINRIVRGRATNVSLRTIVRIFAVFGEIPHITAQPEES